MQGKINIEVLSQDKAIIHVQDLQGKCTSKMVTTKAAAAALAGPNGEAKDSGLIPQNILRIWENSQYKGYLIYQPSRMFGIKYEGRSLRQVKLPGIVMKAVVNSRGQFIGDRSSIFICNGDEIKPDTKLWHLRMNNYSSGYGICWGDNKNIVNSILASGNLFDIEQLPQLFFGSTFNSDLDNTYIFDNSMLRRINENPSIPNHRNLTVQFFTLKGLENEDYNLESELMTEYDAVLSGIMM